MGRIDIVIIGVKGLKVVLCLQHTIKGKMTYAPVVGRLDCGVFPSDPKGFWQQDGYGILSVFKTDWNTFGGMIMFLQFPISEI